MRGCGVENLPVRVKTYVKEAKEPEIPKRYP